MQQYHIVGELRPFLVLQIILFWLELKTRSSLPPKHVYYELKNLPCVQCWRHSSPQLHDIPAEHLATFSEHLSMFHINFPIICPNIVNIPR